MRACYDPDHHHRHSVRLAGYDYGQNSVYFITIVARNRRCLFGEAIDGVMQLNDAGQMIATTWPVLTTRFPTVQLDAFVVMPNHIHSIIALIGGTTPNVGAPLVGALSDHVGAPPDTAGARSDIALPDTRASTRVAPTLGDIVGAYKSLTTVYYTRGVTKDGWLPFVGRLWQRNYYEHIIRNAKSMNRIREYIGTNPARWAEDAENPTRRM